MEATTTATRRKSGHQRQREMLTSRKTRLTDQLIRDRLVTNSDRSSRHDDRQLLLAEDCQPETCLTDSVASLQPSAGAISLLNDECRNVQDIQLPVDVNESYSKRDKFTEITIVPDMSAKQGNVRLSSGEEKQDTLEMLAIVSESDKSPLLPAVKPTTKLKENSTVCAVDESSLVEGNKHAPERLSFERRSDGTAPSESLRQRRNFNDDSKRATAEVGAATATDGDIDMLLEKLSNSLEVTGDNLTYDQHEIDDPSPDSDSNAATQHEHLRTTSTTKEHRTFEDGCLKENYKNTKQKRKKSVKRIAKRAGVTVWHGLRFGAKMLYTGLIMVAHTTTVSLNFSDGVAQVWRSWHPAEEQ